MGKSDDDSSSNSFSLSERSVSNSSSGKSKRKIRPIEDEAFQILKKSSNSSLILKHLDQRYLWEKSALSGETIFNHLLTNSSTNGIRLASQQLDKCIISSKEDANEFIEVDLQQIDIAILRDILHFKSNVKVMKLLEHPALKIFLKMKWRKVKWFFFFNFLIYLMFLFVYSAFLGDIFYRRTNQKISVNLHELSFNDGGYYIPSTNLRSFAHLNISTRSGFHFEPPAKKLRLSSTFSRCRAPKNGKSGSSYRRLVCSIEVGLTLSLVLLFTQEVLQLLALRPKAYFREFENWLELCIIGIVVSSLITQRDLDTFKWLSAIGVCLSYLELIFLMGRYPLLGGRISLMFYSITKHLYRSVLTLFVFVVGFAFGFFIISHSKPNDHFENPVKAILKTLVMILGEFEFDDLYTAHENDMVSLTFTMVLLVGLIFIGSMVLINLLVAIIVSDLHELRHIGMMQELINKAQQIILVEGMLSYFSNAKLLRITKSVNVCNHFVCDCKNESSHAIEEIRLILKKRHITEELKRISPRSKDKFARFFENILTNEELCKRIFEEGLEFEY
eukprot:TRINITY_DN5113_c0_g1_i1.p1 TRINITY_DN5113_c0_g1~~TRINITY_DN5113_c0_g1_i1.p1  ORF type:complete len:560 (-),score=54.00 TRINITY_DN5113_c0_g1_i1:83-1762(-)